MTETEKHGTFVCSVCQGTFPQGKSDEEVWEEFDRNLPEASRDMPMAVVCDDCYAEFIFWYRSGGKGPLAAKGLL